jgi:hypothetical protein
LRPNVPTDLRGLLRNRWPFSISFCPARLKKEGLHLAHFVEREIGSIDSRPGYAPDPIRPSVGDFSDTSKRSHVRFRV